jgi:CheY-like chemotaxis protein
MPPITEIKTVTSTGRDRAPSLASNATPRSNAATLEKTRPNPPETILVVDDEPVVRQVMVLMLRRQGYRVIEAAGPLEAQALSRTSGKIDVLLTDFSMPEINGAVLARWFRANYPTIKVLIATGSLWEFVNQVDDQEQFAVLAKPFDGAQLCRMVRLVLEEARTVQGLAAPMTV